MGKNRLMPRLAASVAIVFFVFQAISCLALPAPYSNLIQGQIISSETKSDIAISEIAKSDITGSNSIGTVYHIPAPDGKLFEPLGIVFATTVTEIDEKGRAISSQEGLVTMLLREAKQLGGHDILNLRIDENITETAISVETVRVTDSNPSGSKTSSIKEKVITKKTITYTGSALAIRYRN